MVRSGKRRFVQSQSPPPLPPRGFLCHLVTLETVREQRNPLINPCVIRQVGLWFSLGLESGVLGSIRCSATELLCDLGHVTSLLCAPDPCWSNGREHAVQAQPGCGDICQVLGVPCLEGTGNVWCNYSHTGFVRANDLATCRAEHSTETSGLACLQSPSAPAPDLQQGLAFPFPSCTATASPRVLCRSLHLLPRLQSALTAPRETPQPCVPHSR